MTWSRVPRWVLVVAGVVMPFAVMGVSWWAAETSAFYDITTDYATPPASPWSAGRLGVLVAGLVLLAGTVVVWVAAARAGRMRGSWWGVQGLTSLAAVAVGGIWSVARLDTADANIGGGLAVVLGLPVAGALVLGACVWAFLLVRERR